MAETPFRAVDRRFVLDPDGIGNKLGRQQYSLLEATVGEPHIVDPPAQCSLLKLGRTQACFRKKFLSDGMLQHKILYCCLPNSGRCGRSQDRVSVNCPLAVPFYPAEWMAETQFRTVDHPS